METKEIEEKVSKVLEQLSQLSVKDAKFILKQAQNNVDRNSKVTSVNDIDLRFSIIN